MNDHDAEVLDYPSAHRDRALALIRRRGELTADRDSLKPKTANLKQVRLSRGICYLAVPAAVVAATLSWTGVLSELGYTTMIPSILLIALVAFIVFNRAAESLDQRRSIDTALDVLDRQLSTLHNDYTDATEGTLQDDLTLIDEIIADPYPGRTKFLTLAAIVGIIAILFTVGVGTVFGKSM